jgi:hypothetical protein
MSLLSCASPRTVEFHQVLDNLAQPVPRRNMCRVAARAVVPHPRKPAASWRLLQQCQGSVFIFAA